MDHLVEIITLSELRERKINIILYHLYVESNKNDTKKNLQNKNKLKDFETKFMVTKEEELTLILLKLF